MIRTGLIRSALVGTLLASALAGCSSSDTGMTGSKTKGNQPSAAADHNAAAQTVTGQAETLKEEAGTQAAASDGEAVSGLPDFLRLPKGSTTGDMAFAANGEMNTSSVTVHFTWNGKLADLERFFIAELAAARFEGGNDSTRNQFLHFYERTTSSLFESVTITSEGFDRDQELETVKEWKMKLIYSKGSVPKM